LTPTPIKPVVAAEGTVTTSCVAVAELTVAVAPWNVTLLLAGVVLKPVPVIVTEAPGVPFVGVNPVIVPSGTVLTVKLVLLVTLLVPT